MNFFVDILGGFFGYILWFFFDMVGNYGVAITLFTAVINILMFPLAIKRQKTTAANSRFSLKQAALKKKYEKDQKKYNEEISKLYEKEGFNPLQGCLSTMVLPLVLWSGIYGAITKPLQNTLHIAPEKIQQAIDTIRNIPEISKNIFAGFEQIQIVKFFPAVKSFMTMFNADELADIQEFSSGFNFMGMNLLNRPDAASFSEMLWLIPVFCFIGSALMLFVNQKTMPSPIENKGCGKYAPYAIFLVTSFFSYTMPAAVGLYWIINSVFGALQSLVLNKYYNSFTINAKEEAAHLAFMELEESAVTDITAKDKDKNG